MPVHGIDALPPLGSVAPPALIPLELMSWLPTWITPVWVIAIGLVAGLLVTLASYAVLVALSFIPPLGHLADKRPVATGVAAVLTLVIAVILGFLVLPTSDYANYRGLLVLPIVAISALLGWGIVYGMWHRTRSELLSIVREGVMPYLLGTAAVVALIGLAGTPLVEDRDEFFASLDEVHLFSDGRVVVPVTLEGVPPDADPDLLPFTKVELDYDIDTLSGLTIETDRTILVSDAADPESMRMTPVRINPDEPVQYERGDLEAPPLPLESDRVHLQNREIDPALVRFTFETRPRVAEARTVPVTAIGFFLLVAAYITFRQAAPRVAAIALATAKSEMAQPLYLVLLALGGVAILLFMILPFHTLGDDIKLFKDSGITLIMVLGIIQAVWSAGTSVSDEIEGRTALTVLSKPVSRRGFLLGKYTGIMLGVFVMFVLLGAILVLATSYKPIFESRENSTDQPVWQVCHAQVVTTIPPLVLYFMETMAIGSIAVALATRLPLLANGVICFVVYVIGNLTAPLVRSSAGDNALVGFVGNLIAVVVPNLNTFNVQSALDSGTLIPPIYLAGAFNYLVCFGIMIFMLALLLFEDRDLA